ncbi:MAG: copper resistance CopC family protein [Actinophytocola sp.]|uniref:copper resistance CopC family protein n=1 Tax=Actinophytocola sp. TaxID=1872138 RepID=UPI003D6BB6EF
MHRRLTIALFAGVLAGGLALGTGSAGAAGLHAELIASTPAENASIASAPTQVKLTFNEPVSLQGNPIEVTGPGNVTWQIGPPAVSGPNITAPVVAQGPAGKYTIVYRVVSGDGDAVSGSVTFTMTAAAEATGAPPTTTTTSEAAPPSAESAETGASGTAETEPAASDGRTLLWVWLLAGAVLLAAIAFVTLRARRSRR